MKLGEERLSATAAGKLPRFDSVGDALADWDKVVAAAVVVVVVAAVVVLLVQQLVKIKNSFCDRKKLLLISHLHFVW